MNIRNKPVCKYIRVAAPVKVGYRTWVQIDGSHPVLGNPGVYPVHTSKVLVLHENGDFETLNTYYKKVSSGERS